MSILTGKEALIALAEGKTIENWNGSIWWDVEGTWQLDVFLKTDRKFRLKPRTITINGIEVPAPFEPKVGEDDCRAYVIDTGNVNGYDWQHSSHCSPNHIVWRTEDEIKQVIAALRQVFGGVR